MGKGKEKAFKVVTILVVVAILICALWIMGHNLGLVPGYDAPVNISWSSSGANRSALIRIPSKRGQDTRIELRNPDSTCNPYLAIALILAAGMDGIEKKMTPPEELGDNLKNATYDDLRESGLETLPMTLGEAIDAYQKACMYQFRYHSCLR